FLSQNLSVKSVLFFPRLNCLNLPKSTDTFSYNCCHAYFRSFPKLQSNSQSAIRFMPSEKYSFGEHRISEKYALMPACVTNCHRNVERRPWSAGTRAGEFASVLSVPSYYHSGFGFLSSFGIRHSSFSKRTRYRRT